MGGFQPNWVGALSRIPHHPDLLDLGIIFCEHTEGLINLQRYENNLEKSFFKAIHELDRIQAKRKGEPTSLPLAIDINSDFDK